MIAQRAVGVIEVKTQSSSSVRRSAAPGSPAAAKAAADRREPALRARQLLSRRRHFGASISVTRNSPVETSTWATPRAPRRRHRREVVVLVRAHQVRVHGGAGRDHARDFARTSFLGQTGSSIWSQMATR
jgi:hypothetical protein